MIKIQIDTSDWDRFRQKFKIVNSAQMMLAMNQAFKRVASSITSDMPARGSARSPRIPSAKPNIITGRLARSVLASGAGSIRRISNVGNGILGELGSSVPYAAGLEKKYPYMVPGLKAAEQDIYQIFRVRLAIAIKEADYV